MRVLNITRGTVLGTRIEVADTRGSRKRGLLGRTGLETGEGLWIVPCEGVHTLFMKFAIDAVYIDRAKRVRKVLSELAPWRFSLCLPAHSVIELQAGTVTRTGTVAGDQLEFQPVD